MMVLDAAMRAAAEGWGIKGGQMFEADYGCGCFAGGEGRPPVVRNVGQWLGRVKCCLARIGRPDWGKGSL